MGIEKLRKINFEELITLEINDVTKYDFHTYHSNGDKHLNIKSYCTFCDDNVEEVTKEEGYALCNISHGSHTVDFLAASNIAIDCSNWNTDGVMFVMENPSKDYNKIYEKIEKNENGKKYYKRPSKQWYWVHHKQELLDFPNNFKGRTYGELIASVILTFKLKNAYITNLVKCGLNLENGDKFKGTNFYNSECIENCYQKFLKKEIEEVAPKVIFAFGRNTYEWLCKLNTGIKIVMLPHPARSQSGFTNEFYQTLYFCLIAKWLLKTRVINDDFYVDLMVKFAIT